MRKLTFILPPLIALVLSFLLACNSSSNKPPERVPAESLAKADIELLFIGNSHSSFNDLPGIVTKLVEAGSDGKTVLDYNAPGFRFLDQRIDDGVTHEIIKARDWTFVFLQAQKYSTTGRYYYPTDAAEEWVRRVKRINATPVMFPEWPRWRNYEEGLRIHQLHESIAQREPACVAPVGLAWDLAIKIHRVKDLHASDGNHSSLKGALLSAYVFYEVVTNNKARDLPYLASINIARDDQKLLAEIASETIDEYPPCVYLE